MIVNDIVDDITKLLDVNTPIIYINDFDFARVDYILGKALQNVKIEEWNPASFGTDFKTKESIAVSGKMELEEFLYEKYSDEYFKKQRYLVLREIQDYIDNPRVKVLLELIAQRKLYDRDYETSVIIVSSVDKIPDEVKKYVSYLEIKYPTDQEIDELIDEHIEINGYDDFDENSREQLKLSLHGMSRFDIDRVIDMAMSSNGSLGIEDTAMILKQKEQMVKKSGILELVNSKESLDDIGGLDALKEYLSRKSKIFRDWNKANKYGVSRPKGVFIVGMPGCGKSLCAKATANIFNAPLLKLDMGSMMGKYVGQSEENLRKAIRTAEAAAPCVLWIDEIEKAFSGVGGNNDIMTRMFGYFLSWMQDKKSNVYVVATANNADNLPPELKRKGRFDEIFCVNLPNEKEREAIFKVHIGKLAGKECLSNKNIVFATLISNTKGFNGADIESVVAETVERCFLSEENKQLNEKELIYTAQNTLSISKSCSKQIEKMKNVFKESCFRDATTGKLTC